MEFVKDFATFLHENGIIKFGDFTLASGKKSPYYVDLRLLPSYPHEFRKTIKYLQNLISEEIGFDNFHSLVSVPTGGLVFASALATEIVKPLCYVRNTPKDHGTVKLIEGVICQDMKMLMIDDVITTGGSVINAISKIKESKLQISNAFVIIDRLEGAGKSLESQGVKLHSILDIRRIVQILHEQDRVNEDLVVQIENQLNTSLNE